MSKRYYWLKLKKDFFKRHDIRIIEAMPNGKDYILFYLKLLVESVDHEGSLRFSDTIPYNADMLAVITNTNIDIVKTALEVFVNLKMIEVLDDQTIYMSEVEKMIGSAADNDNANRQRRFRDRQKTGVLESGVTKNNDTVTKNNASVTECVTKDNESKSKSKSIELDNNNIDSAISPVITADVAEKESMFEKFWEAYPKCFRKVDKKGCKAKFIRIKNLKELFPDIMASLELQKRSKQWNENNGKFIPMPATWINQERWTIEDERLERQQIVEDLTDKHGDSFLF